jgi:hypothetical protein
MNPTDDRELVAAVLGLGAIPVRGLGQPPGMNVSAGAEASRA